MEWEYSGEFVVLLFPSLCYCSHTQGASPILVGGALKVPLLGPVVIPAVPGITLNVVGRSQDPVGDVTHAVYCRHWATGLHPWIYLSEFWGISDALHCH